VLQRQDATPSGSSGLRDRLANRRWTQLATQRGWSWIAAKPASVGFSEAILKPNDLTPVDII